MGKIKYFRTLPEGQKYYFKSFTTYPSKQGTTCDECGAYIVNVVTVVGSVDKISYNLGSTCCEKAAKGLKDIDLDDEVAVRVKFWKGRLAKLTRFRKSFDKAHKENTIAIQGQFFYNSREKQAKMDFGFLYEDGSWWWMHEDFPITKIYNKVKEEFADIWDQVDWMGMDACAKMETSAEVYQAMKDGTVKATDWNNWNDKHYVEWSQKNEIKWYLENAYRRNYQYGPGVKIVMDKDFDPFKYPEGMFDEVVANLGGVKHPEFEQSEFVVTNKEALKRYEMGDNYVARKSKSEKIAELVKLYNEGKLTSDEVLKRAEEINKEED